jgi:hypothetical protein
MRQIARLRGQPCRQDLPQSGAHDLPPFDDEVRAFELWIEGEDCLLNQRSGFLQIASVFRFHGEGFRLH